MSRINQPPQPQAVQQTAAVTRLQPAPELEPTTQQTTAGPPEGGKNPEIIIYSHSSLFYWWPVWVVGYIMAAITFLEGQDRQLGVNDVWFSDNSNLGVIFFLTLFLVILITNITMRGLISALVIVSGALVTVTLAWFGLWNPILNWFGNLQIQLNLGAYFWFSTLMFLVWVLTTFVFDHLSYWRIRPGQVTHEFVFGAAEKSYDTDNMVLEKFRDNFFLHWILGFGSGDLHLRPFGAQREEIPVPNVLFVGSKIRAMQHLLSAEPTK